MCVCLYVLYKLFNPYLMFSREIPFLLSYLFVSQFDVATSSDITGGFKQ